MKIFSLFALIGIVVGGFRVPVAPPAGKTMGDVLKNIGSPSYNASNLLKCKFNSGGTVVLDCYLKGCVDDSKGGGSWCDMIAPYGTKNANGSIDEWQSTARVHLNYTDIAAVFFDSVKYSSIQPRNSTGLPVANIVYGGGGFGIKTVQEINANGTSVYTTAESIGNEADNLVSPQGQKFGKVYGSFGVNNNTHEVQNPLDNGEFKEKSREVLRDVAGAATCNADGRVNMPLRPAQIFSYIVASLLENDSALQSIRFVLPEFFKLEYDFDRNRKGTVFLNEYLKNNRGKLRTGLMRELKLSAVTKEEMNSNPEQKGFALIPLIRSEERRVGK
ncbi:MAG: hypothetical protein LBI29_04195, partial [Rickettsiales bacterium]|nr:hypothetical protein [Rickettsiales bacterium]